MVDLGIMNDFANNEEALIFKNLARGISEIDRALDAVAKPELFCEPHCSFTGSDDSSGTPNFVNDVAAIMRLHLFLHRGHYVGRAQIHFLPRRRPARNDICVHKIMRRSATSLCYSINGPLGF